jgi:hypothetical protein
MMWRNQEGANSTVAVLDLRLKRLAVTLEQ